jgi:hypothetical protein
MNLVMSIRSSRWSSKGKLWCVALVGVITFIIAVWAALGHQRRAFAARTHCVGNLVQIRLAKLVCQGDLGLTDGDPIPDKALDKYLSKPLAQHRCPSGGTYLIENAGVLPKCTYTNACYTYEFDKVKLRMSRRVWRHSL